jgi:hypothetical protein
MKLGKILGTLLVLLAMFVFVGCGDPGVLTLEVTTYHEDDCLYESMTLSLWLGYQDYRDCEKVDKIVLYNKTLDKVIYETENSPYKNPKSLYEIKIDYDWVTEEEGEKVYEYYWQHGENISNTVAVKVKHYNPFRVFCDESTAISAGSDDYHYYNIQKLYYIPDVYRVGTIQGSMYTRYYGEKFSDPFYLILDNYEDDKFFSSFNTLTQYVMNEGENSFTKTDVLINNRDIGDYTVNFTPTASCKIYFETPNGDKSDVITLEKVNLDPDLQCIYDISAEEIDESLKLHANSTEQQRTITVSFNGNNKEMILYNNVTFEAEVIPPFVGKMEKEIDLPLPDPEVGYDYIEPILCLKWKWGKLGTDVCDIAGAVTYVNPDNYTE